MLFNTPRIIGIDIGNTRAKAVLLERGSGASIAIRDYAMDQWDGDDVPLDDRLRRLLRKLRTRCRDCAVSAWPTGARLRVIDHEADPELGRKIKYGKTEASELFFEDLQDYVVECGEIAGVGGQADGSLTVACGVPGAAVSAIEAALRKLRYRLRLFQLTPIAILNAFATSQFAEAKRKPFVLVDFGRARMTIIGGHKGVVRMIRRVDFVWGEIPEPLISVPNPQDPQQGDAIAGEDDVLAAIFGEVSDLLASELQPLLDYFENQDDSENLTQIYISGGLSNHKTVVRRLVERLNLQCVQWNPFRCIGAHQRALKDFTLFSDLAHLPAAAGAAIQCIA